MRLCDLQPTSQGQLSKQKVGQVAPALKLRRSCLSPLSPEEGNISS